jgi:hypothetical protein
MYDLLKMKNKYSIQVMKEPAGSGYPILQEKCDGLYRPKYRTKDVWEHQKSLRKLMPCPRMFKSERK